MQKNPLNLQGLYLTFTLGKQLFAMRIDSVREINQLPEVTPVPNTTVSVAGVINLRGKVIAVVDLRLKFNLTQRAYSRETCIIVVDGHQGPVAAIVDSVAAVHQFTLESIDVPPSAIQEHGSEAILGIGKIGKEVAILLDIAKAVDTDQLQNVADLSALNKTQVA